VEAPKLQVERTDARSGAARFLEGPVDDAAHKQLVQAVALLRVEEKPGSPNAHFSLKQIICNETPDPVIAKPWLMGR
jgi:hypothetical protein